MDPGDLVTIDRKLRDALVALENAYVPICEAMEVCDDTGVEVLADALLNAEHAHARVLTARVVIRRSEIVSRRRHPDPDQPLPADPLEGH